MTAADRLEVSKTYKLYINGSFPRTESGRSLIVHDRKGKVFAHLCHGSRKDLRDAVEAAAAAQPKWAAATAYNRGQVLYRMAEMMEGKRDEFTTALMVAATGPQAEAKAKSPKPKAAARTMKDAQREVEASIDRLVCFGGWADKYAQVLGCNNPVAGPYYNFTVPEPTGVVGIIAPPAACPLLAMVSLLAAALCPGNAVALIADEGSLLPAAILGEVCATSDVPAGVVNIITGQRGELLNHLAQHRGINAISAANLPKADAATLRQGAAENLKRICIATIPDEAWFQAERCAHPWTIEPLVEMKTIWHPAGA